MGGGCHDVCVLDRVLEQTRCDETGGVGHIDPKEGSHLVGDGAHPFIVPLTGICRSASDDEFRPALAGSGLHLVVVDHSGLLVETVSHSMIEDSGGVDRRSVGQVASL